MVRAWIPHIDVGGRIRRGSETGAPDSDDEEFRPTLAPSPDGDGDGDGDRAVGGEASMSFADTDIHATGAISSRRGDRGPGVIGRCFWHRKVAIAAASLVAAVAFALLWNQQGRTAAAAPTHPGFVLQDTTPLPELGADLHLYRHRRTDAELAAFVPRNPSPGDDKAFGIGFRTKPKSSNGVAHILEHSVLAGSAKYPAKDPFLYLLKGSLHTFLNAFTYPDRTLYPVASRNRQDFQNLMDVYLDAVFYPRCITDEGWWVLRQEGWRYEVSESGGEKGEGGGELELRGVVFSEMLGAYSDPEEVLYQTSQSHLFPDTTYHWDSGGDPAVISSLTREEYVDFYRAHYHPTNSKSFVSGDADDVAAVMDLADSYMKHYDLDASTRTNSQIPYQTKSFKEPVRRSMPYSSSEEGENGGGRMVLISWLLNDDGPLPLVAELALLVLDDMLLGSPSSVLEKALLDSGLGEDVIDDGIDRGMLQATFQVGMKGVKGQDDLAKVERIVMGTLQDLVEKGFDDDDIESSLNSIEFHLREFHSGSTPLGISLYTSIMDKWNYDIHPKNALAFEDTLQELKGIINRSGAEIFRDLIRDFLLDNSHRVVVDLYPSSKLEADQLQEEKDSLAKIRQSLSPEGYQDIVDEAKSLEEIQSTDDPPEVIASIPSLELDDLDQEGVEYPIDIQENAHASGVTRVTHVVPSSYGIAYIDFGFDISSIPYEDVPLLPLLMRMMLETGTDIRSDVELDRQISMHTGGIRMNVLVEPILPDGVEERVVTSGTNLRSLLFIRGKSTKEKTGKLLSLFGEILTSASLDSKDKALQILRESLATIESDMQSDGNFYARARIRARYSVRAFILEELGGARQLDVIKFALDLATTDWPTLLARLLNMREKILGSSLDGMVFNLAGDKSVVDAANKDVKAFLSSKVPLLGNGLESSAKEPLLDFASVDHPWVVSAKQSMTNLAPIEDEGIVVSTKVSYVGKGGQMYSENEKVPGSASVVSGYLQNGYLWDTIRVKNGAYGANAYLYADEGVMILMSYRDPNLEKTLEVYDGASDQLIEDISLSAFTNSYNASITTAIIGAIGHLDGSSLPPGDIGWISLIRWIRGESVSARHLWRTQILHTNVEDFESFAQRLNDWDSPSVCAVSSQSMFDEMAASPGAPQLKVVLTV